MSEVLPPLQHLWLGTVPYRDAWQIQEDLRRRVIAGATAETVLTLEHPPVVTLGRGADPRHVLHDEAQLAAAGIERVATSRGGDVTWHGPGQLVAYPVVRLERGVVAHVQALAGAVIDVLAPLGIKGEFRRDAPGVWLGPRKLCSIGVHIHKRVSIHGLALNVRTAPGAFACIVPCGLRGVEITSLHALLGDGAPGVAELAAPLASALAARLRRCVQFLSRAALPSLLS
jgi:lipoate-protein ligase B